MTGPNNSELTGSSYSKAKRGKVEFVELFEKDSEEADITDFYANVNLNTNVRTANRFYHNETHQPRGNQLKSLFRIRFGSHSDPPPNYLTCKRLQQPRLSLLGKPINYKPTKYDPRYRRIQTRIHNFLERPRGLDVLYHLSL